MSKCLEQLATKVGTNKLSMRQAQARGVGEMRLLTKALLLRDAIHMIHNFALVLHSAVKIF